MNLALKATVRVACGLTLVAWTAFSLIGPLTNGTFGTGNLTGWTTLGTAMVSGATGNIVPTVGSFQALIGSGADGLVAGARPGPTIGFAKPSAPHRSARSSAITSKAHPGNPSPSDPGYPDVPEATLESALGLPTGAIGVALPNNYTPTDGSVIYQTFTAPAGSTLSFSWNFATNEIVPTQWDAALYSLQAGSNPAQVFELADTTQSSVLDLAAGTSSPFSTMTGYKSKSITLPAGGTYTIGFISMQTGDNSVSSGTYISNVQAVGEITPSATPIPATWSLGIMGLGLIVLYSGMRKLRKAL